MTISDIRFSELERRIDAVVSTTAQEMIWGKALFRQFDQHCKDDEVRHVENVERLDAIRDKQFSNAEANAAAQRAAAAAVEAAERSAATAAAAVQALNDRLENMMPTLRRMRAREAFRRKVKQCLSRQRTRVVGAGVAVGALLTWYGDHWPKIAAVLRKFGIGGN